MTTGPPAAAAEVAALVERHLAGVLDEEVSRWAALLPSAAEPFLALQGATLAGGKRLRAAFCFWAFVGAGGDRDDPVLLDACAALEVLHAAALIHDDVIDRSQVRHGVPALHVQLGTGAAVVVGDLALGLAQRLVAGSGSVAAGVFADMCVEVNVGQYLDLIAAGGAGAGEADTRLAGLVARYKTAKYTVERPLHLGVALAAPERLSALSSGLSAFGLPLGEAFQLRDDLLAVFGDQGKTGKPVGGDLREGKVTLLVALARSRAEGDDATLFEARFGRADLSELEVAAFQRVIAETGARPEVESRIDSLLAESCEALDSLQLSSEARSALRDIADFAARRVH